MSKFNFNPSVTLSRPYIFLLICFLFLVVPSFAIACALDDTGLSNDLAFDTLKKEELGTLEGLKSTEGNQAIVWRDDENKTRAFVSTTCGETGRVVISYFLSDTSNDSTLVEVVRYRYRQPIGMGDVVVASKSTDTFVICGDESQNYPDSGELSRSYEMAHEILFAMNQLVGRQ